MRSRAWSSPWSWSRTRRRCAASESPRHPARRYREHRGEVEALALPVRDAVVGVEHLGVADRLVDAAEPELGEIVPDVLGDEPEEVLDELRLAVESRSQFGVLGRHADRTGVEVADPHHDAARHHQRCGGEAVLLGAEQRRDDHVSGGAHAAVALHGDAVPQSVEHQRLLGVGQPDLPRRAGVFEAGQRRGAGAAVVAGDQHDVGVRLGDTGRDRADTDAADELDVDAGVGVGVLQVVDELGQILDRVDVVVRRRGDQPDAGRRVPGLGDVRIHLVARKLAALTGFGALSHLDLDVGGVHQVVAGDAEATGGDLFDGAAASAGRTAGRCPHRPRPSWTGRRGCSWRWPWSRGPRRRWSRNSLRRC